LFLRFVLHIALNNYGSRRIAQDEINLKRALESLDDILKSKYKMKINRKQEQKLRFASKILKLLVLKWMTTP
jgi:hypothetical protein